ncbi:MAG: outer membrane lipoprotein-sorting protein [Verrucomicrobia bacterium]|nr:outer membrane lipoprotein-sorting protein [Verrucomicrobiota bacterium]MDE3099848.1 outer membrane lipoprotein-sorting protein [Verrucomicrobiota bacterium]
MNRPSVFRLIPISAAIYCAALAATAAVPSSTAAIQGGDLARRLCEIRPDHDVTNVAVLQIQPLNHGEVSIPLICEAVVTLTNWSNVYIAGAAAPTNSSFTILTITHSDAGANRYSTVFNNSSHAFSTADPETPLAGSDFSAADLGLEFCHWPDQTVLRKEFARGRGCLVLQSVNPRTPARGYSRVVSWIDEKTLGIVEARAYDRQGRLLKIFEPKSFKKIKGQWELQDMEMRNVQTHSRTWIKFKLKQVP